MRSASDILGDQVVRILDPEAFAQRFADAAETSTTSGYYLAEYEKYVEADHCIR